MLKRELRMKEKANICECKKGQRLLFIHVIKESSTFVECKGKNKQYKAEINAFISHLFYI